MKAAMVLYADRVPAITSPEPAEFERLFCGLFSAAKSTGVESVAAWVLCPAEAIKENITDTVIEITGRFGADVLFALSPAFFPSPEVSFGPALSPLCALYDSERPDLLIFDECIRSRVLAVRLACRAGARCATEVRGILRGETLALSRAAYNANLVAEFTLPLPSEETPAVLTVVPSGFPKPNPDKRRGAVTTVELPCEAPNVRETAELSPFVKESGLRAAEHVVVCGYGIGGRENAKAAEQLAEALGAFLGGTRPTVIEGWTGHGKLIGISGAFVNPKVCVVLGASGARAFAAGIKSSKLLIGVNTDGKAPLFRICDYGAVCDCVAFAEELTKLLVKADKG